MHLLKDFTIIFLCINIIVTNQNTPVSIVAIIIILLSMFSIFMDIFIKEIKMKDINPDSIHLSPEGRQRAFDHFIKNPAIMKRLNAMEELYKKEGNKKMLATVLAAKQILITRKAE